MSPDALLVNIPLFQALSAADKARLVSSIQRQSIKKNEVLFNKGDEGTTLYVIIRGSIKIVLPPPSPLGEEVVLAVFSDSDFFGEMALLDGMPRSADAVACEDSELCVLNRTDFVAFLQNNPAAIQAILTSLSLRLRKTDDFLQDTCFLNVSGRLAKKLLQLVEEHGNEEQNVGSFELPLTQSDLARMVGASRESINKGLRVLREKGLITVQGGTFTIHNMLRLKRRVK
ncbi:MAG: Crp/Fnr family transcriptional regulator [Syntrophales bacterium]|jgi:CRP-like cAMP-binding protein|nr:Crp/Fnr family transcriptional regulator [Syntrophales bacterium]MCK9527191.1 Crp/Fnr family transcriptional regulator [Syntrophales bacterium]MDX9921684.1 Crp/Fnr family transcriptional regulator [Syntrophales bacterium]